MTIIALDEELTFAVPNDLTPEQLNVFETWMARERIGCLQEGNEIQIWCRGGLMEAVRVINMIEKLKKRK